MTLVYGVKVVLRILPDACVNVETAASPPRKKQMLHSLEQQAELFASHNKEKWR
jgi:hypothetical protein